MTEGEADAWREQARRRSEHVFVVAEALHALRGQPGHLRRWGFATFGEWSETELGFGKRTAEQYVALWAWLNQARPDRREHLRSIPWTKLRLLMSAGYRADEDVPHGIAEAPRARLEGRQPATDAKSHHFVLDPDQTRLLNDALVRAGQLSGSNYASHNLTVICQDFLATNAFGKIDDPETLARYVHRLELALGVRLIALDKSWDIVAGEEHLIAVARHEAAGRAHSSSASGEP